MYSDYELIQHAVDSNVFKVQSTGAVGVVNPTIWNKMLLDYQTSQLVVTKMGRTYNDLLSQPGEVLNVQVDAEPTNASALTETTAVPIDTLVFTQIQFTPTEYGAAYQVTDKESRRSFVDLMQNIVKKLGYRMALKKEKLVIAALQAGAGNTVVANGVDASAIASTDTVDSTDITKTRATIKSNKFTPVDLILGIGQEEQLLNLSTYNDASKYGGREAILGGKITETFGVTVWWSDLIESVSNVETAIMLGVTGTGEESFGIANKLLPTIETERHARDRSTDFVGVEEYQVKILHANAICLIKSYSAY